MSLQNNIFDFIAFNADLPEESIVWNFDNGPRASLPYITLHVISVVPKGSINKSTVTGEENFSRKLGQHYNITLSVQYFGSNALNELAGIDLNFKKIESLRKSKEVGLTYVSNISLQDLSLLLDSRNEERASMDVLLCTLRREDEIMSIIERVEITSKINNRTGEFYVN